MITLRIHVFVLAALLWGRCVGLQEFPQIGCDIRRILFSARNQLEFSEFLRVKWSGNFHLNRNMPRSFEMYRSFWNSIRNFRTVALNGNPNSANVNRKFRSFRNFSKKRITSGGIPHFLGGLFEMPCSFWHSTRNFRFLVLNGIRP